MTRRTPAYSCILKMCLLKRRWAYCTLSHLRGQSSQSPLQEHYIQLRLLVRFEVLTGATERATRGSTTVQAGSPRVRLPMLLVSIQPLTEMSARNLAGDKSSGCVRLTTSPPSVSRLSRLCTMWEPRRLITLWASTACYGDSFTVLMSFQLSHVACF
jgi:hypothetical protein